MGEKISFPNPQDSAYPLTRDQALRAAVQKLEGRLVVVSCTSAEEATRNTFETQMSLEGVLQVCPKGIIPGQVRVVATQNCYVYFNFGDVSRVVTYEGRRGLSLITIQIREFGQI